MSKEKTVETLPETDSSSEYESDSEGSEEGSRDSHIVARYPPLIYPIITLPLLGFVRLKPYPKSSRILFLSTERCGFVSQKIDSNTPYNCSRKCMLASDPLFNRAWTGGWYAGFGGLAFLAFAL